MQAVTALFYVGMKLDVKQQFNYWSNSSDFYLGRDPFEYLQGNGLSWGLSLFFSVTTAECRKSTILPLPSVLFL